MAQTNSKKQHIKVRNISKSYSGKQVIKNISMDVKSGQVIGLLGPNGAGKTTCFYIISGLVKPNHGKVFLDDLDMTTMPMYKRARHGVSYLPQEASVFRKLSGLDNLLAVIELRKDIKKKDRVEFAQSLLEEFEISHIANRLGYQMSGGERRRVEIARAIASNPVFLLFDEPFAGIDPVSIIGINEIILNLARKGLGILIIDHNVQATLDLCEHIYIVNDGNIMAHGTAEEILNNSKVHDSYLGRQYKK